MQLASIGTQTPYSWTLDDKPYVRQTQSPNKIISQIKGDIERDAEIDPKGRLIRMKVYNLNSLDGNETYYYKLGTERVNCQWVGNWFNSGMKISEDGSTRDILTDAEKGLLSMGLPIVS